MPIQIIGILQTHFGDQAEIDFYDQKGDGKHFYLSIISDVFIEKSRIIRSQEVYKLLDDFLQTGSIHALTMKLKTPAEV